MRLQGNGQGRPAYSQSSPMFMSYITIGPYQNQEIGIGTIHRAYSDFISLLCTHLLCMYFYPTLSLCTALHNHHLSQDTQLYHHLKNLLYDLFIATIMLFPIPKLCSSFLKFYLFKNISMREIGLKMAA